jgi:hypothetical protein
MHRDKFPIIKPSRCTNFWNLFWKWNSTCFGQFLCPPSGVIHYTQQWYMSYRFVDSFRAAVSGWNCSSIRPSIVCVISSTQYYFVVKKYSFKITLVDSLPDSRGVNFMLRILWNHISYSRHSTSLAVWLTDGQVIFFSMLMLYNPFRTSQG